MKTINVESLAGRCAPSSDFVSNRSLAIQTDPLLTDCASCSRLICHSQCDEVSTTTRWRVGLLLPTIRRPTRYRVVVLTSLHVGACSHLFVGRGVCFAL